MITQTDLINRQVTQTDASRIAGLPRGSVAKLRYTGDFPGIYSLAGCMSLKVVEKLAASGIEQRSAARAASLITSEDWKSVVSLLEEKDLFFCAVKRGDYWSASIVSEDHLAGVSTTHPIIVNLTSIYREVEAHVASGGEEL